MMSSFDHGMYRSAPQISLMLGRIKNCLMWYAVANAQKQIVISSFKIAVEMQKF